MISEISGTSPLPALPRSPASDGSDKSKEAALQQKIDANSAEEARCGCKDTAAKIAKEVAGLKAQLSALQASDKNTGSASGRHVQFGGCSAPSGVRRR